MGLKFGHDAWIGPEGDNKDFHRDSFCSFLIKNQKPPQLGFSHCTLLAYAALRIWFTPRGFLYFFFSAIFSESSEPMGLKFGHDAWIGPEGDNKDFHRDSFYSFFFK